MSDSKFHMLVGDMFRAECKNPHIHSEKNAIHLAGRATCWIEKESESKELNVMKIKYSAYTIKKDKTLSDMRELHCLYCDCSGLNKEKICKKHTGSDRVKPFKIDRISESPAISIKVISATPSPHATIRRAIYNIND